MPRITELMQTMDYGPALESTAEAQLWLDRTPVARHFINGVFVAAGAQSAVLNPATGRTLAQVCHAGAAEVDQAVDAARAAFGPWSQLSGHARAGFLYAMARAVQKRERLFATLETLDNGKPLREARDIDIPLVARHFYHHAGWAEVIDTEFPDHAPLGVCGQIIPWNFPLLMLAWKVAPALAAGNTVVLKPADLTPLTATLFAEICHEIGLPAGVVNILHGGAEAGSLLANHAGIDKVAFTGSTAVGKRLRAELAGSGKALSLELGGKSPFIVFEDADLDAAVEGVVDAIWFNQGEVCCAGSRILVQEGVAERFYDLLRARMAKLRTGDPLDKSTDIGAIVSGPQLARIRTILNQSIAQGAVLHSGAAPLVSTGHFIAPGFLTDLSGANIASQVEIFGPIAVTATFRTVAEAISLANDTRYGLAASVWSENINKAVEAASKVKAGVVWINATNLLDAGAGFGGMRESGFGREGGREGQAAYLKLRGDGGQVLRAEGQTDWDSAPSITPTAQAASGGIDITARHWIGGKFARADGGQSASVMGADGAPLGQVAVGSRKDIRNAVEAAAKAGAWGAATAHNRAQVLYFIAENLDQRRGEFAELLSASQGNDGAAEVDAAIRRCFWYAAQADKFDGATSATKSAHLTLQIPEPWGVMGVVCPDEAPLLALVSLVMPALAMGNRVVCLPSEAHPLVASRFAQVLAVSDVPAGALNLISGPQNALAKTLAEHDEVAALWYFGTQAGAAMVEAASVGNLKAIWTDQGILRDWADPQVGQGRNYLRAATQLKTIWLPYGV